MKVILDNVVEKEICGHITVSYPELQKEALDDDEYDEDEQLYAAVSKEAYLRKYQSAEIPVYRTDSTSGSTLIALVVPHFTNPIAERILASEIGKLGLETTKWVVLAPCMINNGTRLCRLDIGTEFSEVPLLQPPHFVTGVVGGIVAELSRKDRLRSTNVLVLNSEGHPGYEKVDADAIMQAVHFMGKYLDSKPDKYEAKMSQAVRKVNSTATSGMYI